MDTVLTRVSEAVSYSAEQTAKSSRAVKFPV
jgi:hypothetical protein